jgi:hypothetical protein
MIGGKRVRLNRLGSRRRYPVVRAACFSAHQRPRNQDSLREQARRRSAAMPPHLASARPRFQILGLQRRFQMIVKKAMAALLLTAVLAGCSQTESQQRTTTGALLGGAGGALVGQAIGHDTKSTVIGAASGALLGAVVGNATTPQEPRNNQLCRYRDPSGRIYVAPCDDRYYNGQY